MKNLTSMDILNGKNKNMTARKILQSAKLDPSSMLIPITFEEANEKAKTHDRRGEIEGLGRGKQ